MKAMADFPNSQGQDAGPADNINIHPSEVQMQDE